MASRRTKQAIYGIAYLVVFIGIIAGVYFAFIRQAPSCFDGIQNEGETGVDCGGPCAKVCTPASTEGLVADNVSIFIPGPERYTFLAQIENHNTGFAADYFDYSFDLYDASGTLLQSFPDHSFIYAGEVKYLLLANVAETTTADHAVLTTANPDWVTASAMGLAPRFGNPLPVTGSIISSSTITVTGRITNGEVASFTHVLVIAVFYDAAGKPAGASQTVIDTIAPNQTVDFSVMYPAAPAATIDPSLTKMFAYALRS